MEFVPLILLAENEEGEIERFEGGTTAKKRLLGLGFTTAIKVKVLTIQPGGPVLVLVRGSKIALGRKLAEKIIVRRTGEKNGE